jgi:hypothetical protein
MDNYSIRISVYDIELDDAIDLAEKARTAMDNEKDGGTYNGVEIASVDFESLSDAYDNAFGDRGLIVFDMNFDVWAIP